MPKNINDYNVPAHSMNLHKEVISNLNFLDCKECVWPLEGYCETRWQPRNDCDSRLMASTAMKVLNFRKERQHRFT